MAILKVPAYAVGEVRTAILNEIVAAAEELAHLRWGPGASPQQELGKLHQLDKALASEGMGWQAEDDEVACEVDLPEFAFDEVFSWVHAAALDRVALDSEYPTDGAQLLKWVIDAHRDHQREAVAA